MAPIHDLESPSEVGVREGARPPLSFVHLLGLPRDSAILHIGQAGRGRKRTFLSLLDAFAGPAYEVDEDLADSAVRANEQKEARIQLLPGDAFSASLPPNIGFCTVTLPVAQMPDLFEELLYEQIYPALAENGAVALHMCRDASDETLDRLNLSNGLQRTQLQSFMRSQFNELVFDDPSLIARKFESCDFFEFLHYELRPSKAGAHIAWVLLRKRPLKPAGRDGAIRGVSRSPRPDQYPKEDLRRFLASLKQSGISLLRVDGFAAQYENYAKDPRGEHTPERPFGLLKFDIHGNVRRALEVARILTEVEVPGLFLMMPRHRLNQSFYDSESTWDALRAIRDLGHEIGLHPDVFDFIRKYGDLYTGLGKALDDIRGRGFQVRTATLHGSTRPHIKAQRLQANDFFEERFRGTKWTGVPPVGEEFFADHIAKYSHGKIASDFGLEYFPEMQFLHSGKSITRHKMLYLTDNHRAFEVLNCPGTKKPFICETPFRVPDAWTQKAIEILKTRPFLALFHPQWYW